MATAPGAWLGQDKDRKEPGTLLWSLPRVSGAKYLSHLLPSQAHEQGATLPAKPPGANQRHEGGLTACSTAAAPLNLLTYFNYGPF